MRFKLVVFLALFASVTPAHADPIGRALDQAIAYVRTAGASLNGEKFGVDVTAYRDALTLHRFTSPHWKTPAELVIFDQPDNGGLCSRYAAFVTTPPKNGKVTLTLCPQFSREGSDALRTLTVLHEMVHVVAGPDECRAMAFAAHVEQQATGSFTPVPAYWQANSCRTSKFKLPN